MTTERPHRVCPWWLGYLLASPLRRILIPPAKVLAGHVRPGMTVLEPGPGMGFFTLELARLVGGSGRVIAVDIQPRMLDGLRRRAAKAGVLDRVYARLARLLLVEPAGHVTASLFDAELQAAGEAGFTLVESPSVRRSRAALLEKVRPATAP